MSEQIKNILNDAIKLVNTIDSDMGISIDGTIDGELKIQSSIGVISSYGGLSETDLYAKILQNLIVLGINHAYQLKTK